MAIDVAIVSVGVLAVFVTDLIVDVPIGVAAGYSLFILTAMLAERTRLILIVAGASIAGILIASLGDPGSADFHLDAADFASNRAMQAGGIVLVAALAVLGVRRRERLAAAEQELMSSVHELEGTAEELRAEQDRLVALAESMPLPVWLTDDDGRITYTSHGTREFLGRDLHDREDWLEVVHPDDRAHALDVILPALAAKERYEVELRVRRHDGIYRAQTVRAVPIEPTTPALAGSSMQWWATASDVQALRQSQRETAAIALQLEETLDSITDGVIVYTDDLHFSYLNRAANEMFSREPGALLGRHIWEAYPHLKGTEMERAFEAVRSTGRTVQFTHYATTIDKWFELTVSAQATGFTVYTKDVTELRDLNQRLERANRLESVGSLTGGIAHDFNNLLTVISGGAEALADSELAPEDEAMRSMIAEAAERGSGLIGALLAFARRQTLSPEPTSIGEAVTAMAPLLERTLGGAIEVSYDIAEGLPTVMVDRGKLDNSVLNLVINARDAMIDGGTVVIEAGLHRHVVPAETSAIELPPGDYVRLAVRDSGTGIAPEALPRLFEPFYTTKPLGSGSGLGLAMVWGFAQQSGGTLNASSEVGAGSTFSLYLPVARVEVEETRSVPTPVPTAGEGTVLLVEDDALVRGYTSRRLVDLGYDVLEASDGRAALDILDSHHDIDLLLTDVVMPGGMSGTDLAREAREARPGLPVLCVSGYTEQVLAADGRLDPESELLTKPYTIHELASRVSRLVSEGRSADA
ncbi:hybrid sensor histidine kinase/response regulator [Demequina salsinemoris]|uniref:hybrid sensor histidine kinase/response regulator n=1 Tax=Demequina salsinemoris TaxID=577470 RepID=UPI000781222B|nr:PAS domain-containing sensor histidine kinase [Demequina salsinemoris]